MQDDVHKMKRPLFTHWDIAIVGAGAAGLMAAISAARSAPPGTRILLIDGRQHIGAKILMSGGTRCNVTNRIVQPSDFHGGPRHIIQHVLEAFTGEQAAQFFRDLGVTLVLEPGGKYFPSTHSGQTILDALVREVQRLGVTLQRGARVTTVAQSEEGFRLQTSDGDRVSHAVILTPGGRSYPTTGSDGTGYDIARSLGHAIVQPSPALTPLTTDDPDWRALSGVTLPVRLMLWRNRKPVAQYADSFLFTHTGFSGPAALNMSRHWIREGWQGPVICRISFLPVEDPDAFQRDWPPGRTPTQTIKRWLADRMPERVAEVLLKKVGVPSSKIINQLTREERQRLLEGLFRYPLEVSGVVGYRKAEATAGGVDLTEVRAATLASRLVPGLYFAGEMLDVDGRIGGFNFQWAWSSGMVAGRAAANVVRESGDRAKTTKSSGR